MDTPSPSRTSSLTAAFDDHLAWLMAWHRAAFLAPPGQAKASPPMSPCFAAWYDSCVNTAADEEREALDRLAVQHDHLHRLAKVLLERHPWGPLSPRDYEAFATAAHAFTQALRQRLADQTHAAVGRDRATGLLNAYAAQKAVERELERLRRGGKPFGLALVRPDDAPPIVTADARIVPLTTVLQPTLRASDEMYRWEGPTLLLLLPQTEPAASLAALERLREVVNRPEPPPASPLTAAFGLVASSPEASSEDLLARAERALSRARAEGPGHIVALGPEG